MLNVREGALNGRRWQEMIDPEYLAQMPPESRGEETPPGASATTPPPAVRTQEEFDALPPGALYTEDGQTYRKPGR
jgi:hypothetical protein